MTRTSLVAALAFGCATEVAPPGFSAWTQDDLEARLRAAGWSLTGCDAEAASDGTARIRCGIQQPDRVGSVALTRYPDAESLFANGPEAAAYDGLATLTATLVDGTQGQALLHTLIPATDPVPLDVDGWRRVFEVNGWLVVDVDEDGASLAFDAVKDLARAEVAVSRAAVEDAPRVVTVVAGGVTLHQGNATVTLSYRDDAGAARLVEALAATPG